jgi:hypothetical protein
MRASDWLAREEEKDDLKLELELKYGTRSHQKADRLFELAWEYGHGNGHDSVESFYEDMVDLTS